MTTIDHTATPTPTEDTFIIEVAPLSNYDSKKFFDWNAHKRDLAVHLIWAVGLSFTTLIILAVAAILSSFTDSGFIATIAVILTVAGGVFATFLIGEHILKKKAAEHKAHRTLILPQILANLHKQGWELSLANLENFIKNNYLVVTNANGVEYQFSHLGIFPNEINIFVTLVDQKVIKANKQLIISERSEKRLQEWKASNLQAGITPTADEAFLAGSNCEAGKPSATI